MYVGKYSSASVIIQNSIKEDSNPRHQTAMVPREYVNAHRISETNTVKPVLNGISKGPEHFSAKARFPFNQGTLHVKIKPGHARIWDKIKHHNR